jgi:hypothetical protein
MILIYILALSVVVGYARGGRLKNYLENPLRGVWLPVAAFLIEAMLPLLGAKLLAPAVIAEYELLFAFIFVNRKLKPVWLMAVGVFLNALVIFVYGFRMPVTPAVYDPVFDSFVQRIKAGDLIEYVLVGWDAPMWFLGDTIPITRVAPGLASIGDLVMGVGMFWLLQLFMKPLRKSSDQKGEPG